MLGPYKFYNGDVFLWFDPEKHVYFRQFPTNENPAVGTMVVQDGVTTIIHIIDKSDALVPWAAKMVYERAMATIPYDQGTVLDDVVLTRPLSTREIDRWLLEAKKAPREIKEKAGDTGTLAHNCIEDSIREARRVRLANEEAVTVKKIINWPITDERSVNCVKAAFDWMNQHNVRWLETERKVYSLKYKYAGTMDGLALVDSCDNPKCKGCKGTNFKDVLSLIDWKSSNGLWVDYLYQTAAYEFAYEEEKDINIVDRWILRLGKEDGEFDPWRIGPDDFKQDFQAFLYCLHLTQVHKAVKERMKVFTKFRNKKS
jgi:hypothetical protein